MTRPPDWVSLLPPDWPVVVNESDSVVLGRNRDEDIASGLLVGPQPVSDHRSRYLETMEAFKQHKGSTY